MSSSPSLPSPVKEPSFITQLFYSILFIDRIRFVYCRVRWSLLKRNLRIMENMDAAVGKDTVRHNLSAFKHRGAFGMARRMSLLLFPVAAIYKDRLPKTRVLIIGPRTEDDIIWAKSLGLFNTDGLDLFTYSPYIQVGDIHNSGIASCSYDVVLLGWVISYTSDPSTVISECLRILKPGGHLGIGIESNADKVRAPNSPRVNSLNTPADLAEVVKMPVVFTNEPYRNVTYDCGVVFKKVEFDIDGEIVRI